eukprot:177358-Pyramimonas_sp.AAC.1
MTAANRHRRHYRPGSPEEGRTSAGDGGGHPQFMLPQPGQRRTGPNRRGHHSNDRPEMFLPAPPPGQGDALGGAALIWRTLAFRNASWWVTTATCGP